LIDYTAHLLQIHRCCLSTWQPENKPVSTDANCPVLHHFHSSETLTCICHITHHRIRQKPDHPHDLYSWCCRPSQSRTHKLQAMRLTSMCSLLSSVKALTNCILSLSSSSTTLTASLTVLVMSRPPLPSLASPSSFSARCHWNLPFWNRTCSMQWPAFKLQMPNRSSQCDSRISAEACVTGVHDQDHQATSEHLMPSESTSRQHLMHSDNNSG